MEGLKIMRGGATQNKMVDEGCDVHVVSTTTGVEVCWQMSVPGGFSKVCLVIGEGAVRSMTELLVAHAHENMKTRAPSNEEIMAVVRETLEKI